MYMYACMHVLITHTQAQESTLDENLIEVKIDVILKISENKIFFPHS